MSNIVFNTFNCLGRVVQNNSNFLLSTAKTSIIFNQNRETKHWIPKWKKWRAKKVIKVKLPKFDRQDEGEETPEKVRSEFKKKGLQPQAPWIERPIFISCTGGVFEPYVPPEGDGKFSIISKAGAKQKMDFMSKKGTSYLAVRKIKSYDGYFTIGEFEEDALEIYKKAHESIASCLFYVINSKDEDALRMYVTEKAFPEAMHNVKEKTVRWKFIESLEWPRVVHARQTNVVTKENIFAQLTVRLHTQQTLAVYDRFGRLMHGSEILKKDVLEYVVFEKHLVNQYGSWRVHGKIIPPWMPDREYSERTYLAPKAEEPTADESKSDTTVLKTPPRTRDKDFSHIIVSKA